MKEKKEALFLKWAKEILELVGDAPVRVDGDDRRKRSRLRVHLMSSSIGQFNKNF